MLDKNEITSFRRLSGALCRLVRENFFSVGFLWKHLLRRFTDCAQLGFSSSSTFWFSASDAQECIENCCRGSEKSLSFPRDVLYHFLV
jgi:hypothetical protein